MIKFKKLHPQAVLPTRATDGSAGFDLTYIGDSTILREGEHAVFETGIAMQTEPAKAGIIKPRSGWAVKYAVDVLAGVIDPDYTGELKVILINHGIEPLNIYTGDRIAQLVVMPFETEAHEVDNLHATDRGCGGFGSTGVN
jgi:dUTP pyrophosphatase